MGEEEARTVTPPRSLPRELRAHPVPSRGHVPHDNAAHAVRVKPYGPVQGRQPSLSRRVLTGDAANITFLSLMPALERRRKTYNNGSADLKLRKDPSVPVAENTGARKEASCPR